METGTTTTNESFTPKIDVAAQRLSDNTQKSSAPKIFAVVRRHDVLSNAKISVTKPPWLFSKTVGSERL